MDILEILAIKVTATKDAISIKGIIPLEIMFSGSNLVSVVPAHHRTNIASLFRCRYSYIEGIGYKLAYI